MPPPPSPLLHCESTLLVVVDMQEKLLSVMHNPAALTANVLLLVRSAAVLGVPVLATTQNAARLGGLSPQVAAALPPGVPAPLDKLSFSCMADTPFADALTHSGRHQIVLCGLETHICVAQTALDLVQRGWQAHVAADAVSSRTVEKHKLGMERVRDGGALPCAAEAAVYELLGAAGTPAFRQILPLVK